MRRDVREDVVSVEIWFAFILAAAVVLVVPGPTIIFIVSRAVTHGRSAVVPLVLGQSTGDLTAMTLSMAGLGAVMASSAALFTGLKWIGALYLIYLGIKTWRSKPGKQAIDPAAVKQSKQSLFQSAFIVTALNPKSIAFFVAFLPQFINSRHDPLPQLLILGTTFLCLAAINATIYAMFAGQLRDAMQNANVQRWFHRCGGSALIGAGVVTTTLQRN
jgi:threonine/homoserine/homoserine lactone efflux protein